MRGPLNRGPLKINWSPHPAHPRRRASRTRLGAEGCPARTARGTSVRPPRGSSVNFEIKRQLGISTLKQQENPIFCKIMFCISTLEYKSALHTAALQHHLVDRRSTPSTQSTRKKTCVSMFVVLSYACVFVWQKQKKKSQEPAWGKLTIWRDEASARLCDTQASCERSSFPRKISPAIPKLSW